MYLLLEDTASSVGNGLLLLHFDRALVHNDHAVPAPWNHVLVVGTLLNRDVDIVSRGSSLDRTFYSKHLASNHFSRYFVVFELRDLSSFVFLVLRLTVFVGSVQVQPELEPICRDIKASRDLRMDNTFTSSHPLEVSRPKLSSISLEILMQHLATEHVSDCLHSSVWMIGEPSWQLHIEIVHHQERIKI